MGIFDRMRGDTIRIHIVIKGSHGQGDVDEHLRLPVGTTLGKLVEVADGANVPLRAALDRPAAFADRLTINGVLCPFTANAERELVDGDEIHIIAPPG